MDWIAASMILFGGLSIVMGFGVPVAIAFLMLDVIGAFFFLGGEAGLSQLARNSVASVTSFSLTPIPFFVLMGEVLFRTGLAIKAIDAIANLIHRVPGRLAVITIVAGTIFSAISGSTIATTAMLGSLMLPTMLARGYEPKMAMGPIMAIGSVDVLIPPSALAVLLGSLAGISISGLLIGGIVPGLILSVIFIGYIVLRAHLNPALAPEPPVVDLPDGLARWRPFVAHVLPLVLIFAVVVGAMTRGWATPTEAAALGAAATIVAAALYRSLTWDNLMTALKGTVAVSGTILFIIVGATTFSQVLSFSGATNGIISLVGAQGLPPWALILGMMLLLIFLGFFVDEVSMMMITLPFFMPLVTQMGVDPIWFGVLFLINMQVGLLSPPFGLLLFAMKGVAPPHITMGQIVQSVMPYLCFGMGVMLLVFLWPPLATWLPRMLGGLIMIEKMAEVPTADGKMDAFIVHPDEGGPFPSVFILMDIWGLREELFDVARRVAVTGYHCILPNFWYRRGKVRFEFRNEKGQMRSLLDLPQKVQDELHDNMNLVTDPMAMQDIRSVLNYLEGEPVRKGPKGSIGFCLGGRLGLAAAGHYPEHFRATASLHGTRLVNETPESPHLLADKFRGSIYCGFAEKDHWAPPETIAAMDKLMTGRDHVRYRGIMHPGTVHGYSLPDRDIFNKASANRDWENIFAMFKRELN